MRTATLPAALKALAAAVWLNYALGLPGVVPDWHDIPQISLEGTVGLALVGAFVAITGRRPPAALVASLSAAITAIMMLRVANMMAFYALGRSFNLFRDLVLIGPISDLLSATYGQVLTILAGAGAVLFLAGVYLATAWSLRLLGGLLVSRIRVASTVSAAAVAAGLFWAGPQLEPWTTLWRPVNNQTTRIVLQQALHFQSLLVEHNRFAREVVIDPIGQRPPSPLFAALGGADVIVTFVESYGRSAVERPVYAPATTASLRRTELLASGAGLSIASGWVESPTMGGQSWLAHSTFQSGMWIDNQARYDLLLASRRKTLTRFFEEAGYETVVVQPAMVGAWPEGSYFGFETTVLAKDLGFVGRPFNWITMPDQFTLDAFDKKVLSAEGRDRPVFAQIALISTHWPWVPIMPVLPWDEIGDGSIFDRLADGRDDPNLLWKAPGDLERIYSGAIEYVIDVIGEFASHKLAGRPTIMIVLGDHEPTPLVTGSTTSRDVPVHILATDPALIQPFLDWGFVQGMVPPPTPSLHRMDAIRDFLVEAFSEHRSSS